MVSDGQSRGESVKCRQVVTMHRTQIFLPKQMHQTLKTDAHERKIGFSELVREILEEYLNRRHRRSAEKGIRALLEMAEE